MSEGILVQTILNGETEVDASQTKAWPELAHWTGSP